MAKRRGRQPNANVPAYLQDKLPKKETELHRQMRAHWLCQPPEGRTFQATAEAFGVDRQTVELPAKAFGWVHDAEQRDNSISDPFYEKHQAEIDKTRLELFRYFCTALQTELKRQAFEISDSDIIEKIRAGDLGGATSEWSTKDWTEFVKKLNVRASGYKDMLHVIEGIQKVVFEWNPNKQASTGKTGITIPGDNNRILIHYD